MPTQQEIDSKIMDAFLDAKREKVIDLSQGDSIYAMKIVLNNLARSVTITRKKQHSTQLIALLLAYQVKNL